MNWMKAGPYMLVNSIAIDGTVFISKDNEILWSSSDDVPLPLVEAWTAAEDAHGLAHPPDTSAATFDAIREQLDGACSHDNGTEEDCCICAAYRLAVQGMGA